MITKKIKALAAVLSAGLFAGTLSGCQLAQPVLQPTDDRLIGVFVTMQSLNDPTLPGGAQSAFPARIDATQTGPTDDPHTKFAFPGVDGMFLMSVNLGGSSYTTTSSGAEVGDVHFTLNTQDSGDSTTLEGTIYVAPSIGEVAFTLNPIYQSSDGAIYATPSTDMPTEVTGGDLGGGSVTLTVNNTATVTSGGKTSTDSFTVKITIKTIPAPQSITIVQMDSNDIALQSTTYVPGQVPDNFNPLANTAYLIVKTMTDDPNDDSQTLPEVYGPQDTFLTTFNCHFDNICETLTTQINWPG